MKNADSVMAVFIDHTAAQTAVTDLGAAGFYNSVDRVKFRGGAGVLGRAACGGGLTEPPGDSEFFVFSKPLSGRPCLNRETPARSLKSVPFR